MHRFLLGLLVLNLLSVAHAQKPPDEKPEASVGSVAVALNTGGHTSPIVGLAFTPDGKKLITVEHREVHVWNTLTGERERDWRLPTGLEATPRWEGLFVNSVAVAPNGKTVAVAGKVQMDDKGRFAPIWLLNLDNGGARLIRPPIAYNISSLAFSPDSQRLAWSTWYQAGVWDLKGNRTTHLLVRGAAPGRVSFGKDSNHLLDCWRVYEKARPQVWDITPGAGKKPLQPAQPLFELKGADVMVAWSPDGSRFADWDKTKGLQIRFWNAEGKREKTAGGELRSVTLPGGPEPDHLQFLDPQRLAVVRLAHDRVRVNVVNVETGKDRRAGEWTLPEQEMQEHRVTALSPDGKFLAVTSTPGFRVLLFDLEAKKESHHLGVSYSIPTHVGWSADSRAIGWSFSSDPKAGLTAGLNLATLEPLRGTQLQNFKGSRGEPGWSIHFEEKDKRANKTRGLTLVHRGKRIETANDSPVGPHTFYKDAAGNLGLALIQHWGAGTLYLIDPETGKDTLLAHDTHGTYLAVSPDGRFLLLARQNQALDVYRIEGKPALVMKILIAGPDWIAWTNAGYYAATPGGERMMGWTGKKDNSTPLTFYPAERFRKQLYRPDVVQLVLEKGTDRAALKAANTERKKQGQAVPATLASVEQLLPPKVTEFRVDDSKKPLVTVKTRAEATVKSQPVLALSLRLDGRPWSAAKIKEVKAGEKPEAEWTVTLPEGEHQLSVLVRGPDTSSVSDPVAVKPVIPAKQPALHVLAVGVNDYQDANLKLKYAAADAQSISTAFKNSCTGAGNLFQVGKCELLIDKKATRQGMRDALADIRMQGVKQNDLVVVFFAGHGVRGKKDKDEFYLLTVEADTNKLADTALSGTELHKALADIPCQVLLMLDACHSAAGVKAFKPATDDATRKLTDDEAAVVVMCAAMGHEEALERTDHGLFTKAVVAGLSAAQGVSFNPRNHRQYIHHLQSYVFDQVMGESDDRQHPFLHMPERVAYFALRQVPEPSSRQR